MSCLVLHTKWSIWLHLKSTRQERLPLVSQDFLEKNNNNLTVKASLLNGATAKLWRFKYRWKKTALQFAIETQTTGRTSHLQAVQSDVVLYLMSHCPSTPGDDIKLKQVTKSNLNGWDRIPLDHKNNLVCSALYKIGLRPQFCNLIQRFLLLDLKDS